MRDVIVIGSGGGGAVVAKELAARGLDVLMLEAGPNESNRDEEWTHFEADANGAASGFLRFGPADRTSPPGGARRRRPRSFHRSRGWVEPPATTLPTRQGPCPASSSATTGRMPAPMTSPTDSPSPTAS